MSGEIIQGVTTDNYDHFQYFNFIFPLNFISLFEGLFNHGIDLRVRYHPGIWYTSFGCINIVDRGLSHEHFEQKMWPSTQSMHHPLKPPYDFVVDEPHNWVTKAHFTLGLKANVQLKSSIPYWCKSSNQPQGLFTLGVKAEIENIFSICPKLLITAELYDLVLAQRLKKRIPSNLGSQFATLRANVPAFINIQTSMF
jgi:hypothetical protein